MTSVINELIMKSIFTFILACFLGTTIAQSEIQETGLPGDHFSLEGVLELYKKSKSPEDFEKKLNKKSSDVNNLDLNEDGDVDYIQVFDYMEGDVHAIALRVAVSENESQDVAVIEIEKTGDERAILQIIGNEEVYGEEILVEPYEEISGSQDGNGPDASNYYRTRIVVNVWFWPSVRYIYRPNYVVWHSPWRWRYYPRWWSPWRPLTWGVYSSRIVVWRPRYHRVTTHRVVRAHKVYTPRRTTSVTVANRTTVIKKNTVAGRSSTTVVKKNGNNVTAVKRTNTAGAVKTSNGAVAGKKTTTTAVKKSGNDVKVARKTTKEGVQSNGTQTRAAKKTTKAGVKKSGNTTTARKKTTTTKARKTGNAKAAKRTTKTKKVKRKKG